MLMLLLCTPVSRSFASLKEHQDIKGVKWGETKTDVVAHNTCDSDPLQGSPSATPHPSPQQEPSTSNLNAIEI
jgi:hypothetical protein